MSRLEKSFKNITLSFGNTMISSLMGFISRTVFIYVLGKEYLGLSGLLMNVLGFLSISELGISTAIGFSLYKPLAENDNRTISMLMSTYRKAYRVIAMVVLVSGIVLYFSLDFFVPPEQQPYGTSVAYFAFLLNTVIGYLLSYKTTLINSDNQGYYLTIINIIVSVAQTILQILVLLLTHSYVAYLVIQTVCTIAGMVFCNRFITKKYQNIDFYSKEHLEPEIKNQLTRNIGGLIVAKIGDYLVNSTDNLIITKLISLAATGIYSNYLMIRNIINGFISTAFSGITASMGNVVAVESTEKKQELFDALMFVAFFVYSFEAVCFLCLFNTFIGDIWLSKEFVFDSFTVAIIVINNYLTGLRMPLITMKSAAGTYMEDAWIPFAFAGINLAASIVLAKHMGVAGVFLGTIVGSLLTADWYRPVIIYRKVLHTSIRKYYKKYLLYVFLGFLYMGGAYWLCSFVQFPFALLNLLVKGIIAATLPLAVNTLLFYKTKEFAMIRSMALRLCNGIRKKISK